MEEGWGGEWGDKMSCDGDKKKNDAIMIIMMIKKIDFVNKADEKKYDHFCIFCVNF